MPRTSLEKKVAERYKEYSILKDQAKELYSAADEILLEIGRLANPKPIRALKISKDELLEVKDLTKGKGIVIGVGHAFVRRYDLRVIRLA